MQSRVLLKLIYTYTSRANFFTRLSDGEPTDILPVPDATTFVQPSESQSNRPNLLPPSTLPPVNLSTVTPTLEEPQASSLNISDLPSTTGMPLWLLSSSEELRAIKGPTGWVDLVNGLCILDAALGYPSGKVCAQFPHIDNICNTSLCQGKSNTISAKDRPLAISNWTKHARSSSAIPVIADISEWAKLWRTWWIGLQPESREGEKLLRVVGADEPWVETKKGGINGFYNVVVSLGWWLEAVSTDSERDEFATVLADVLWVMNHMIANCHPANQPAK